MRKQEVDDLTRTLSEADRDALQKTLDDTQNMPPLDTEDEDMAQPIARQNRVRELEPLDEPDDAEGKKQQKFLTTGRKKKILLVGGFLVALFLGFFVAGYQKQNSEEAQQARLTQAELAQKQEKLASDTQSLKKQKAELEQEKQALEAKKQELLQQSARAEGRSEQIDSDQSTGLGKLVDKVTGREKKRQQAASEAATQKNDANQQADGVDQSIAEAQQMLDEVNDKLSSVAQMKQEADHLKAQAQDAYAENKGTVDTVLSYVATGAQALGNLLFH